MKKKPPVKKRAGGASRVNGLLPKQWKFVQEYLLCGNATQAALAAGYSQKTARVIGQENLLKPAIAGYLSQKQTVIAAKQDECLEKMELTQERIMRETARIAFFDARKMFHADGRPKSILELDDDTAACIVGLEVLEEYDGRGEGKKLIGHVKKYKIADKNASIDRGGKFLNMFEKDNEGAMGGVAKALNAMSNTERAVRIAALLAAAKNRKPA
jgi:phage terminase small subunit